MKYNIGALTFGLILLAISAVVDVNYLDYGSPIPFSRINDITFSDFRGVGKPGLTLEGSTEFAYISTNIQVKFLSNASVEITSYFHPSRSYVYKQHIRSRDLLTHELYHFRITEYCSRMLRAELGNLTTTTSKGKIREIQNKYVDFERALQLQYDDETYHSYVLSKQKKWQDRIDADLLALESYSNTIVIFPR